MDSTLALEVPVLSDLSVQELAEYLKELCVSSQAIDSLIENQVSGRALLLVDEGELKELLHTIGDRAVVRDLLNRARKKVGWLCSYLVIADT